MKSVAKIPSCQTQIDALGAQLIAVSSNSGKNTVSPMSFDDCIWSSMLNVAQGEIGRSGISIEAGSERRLRHAIGIESSLPSRLQCVADNEIHGSPLHGTYDLDLPSDSEGSESNQGPAFRQRASLPSSSILPSSISREIPTPQVDGNDPLCHVVQVQELAGMSLMTSFQPDLKLLSASDVSLQSGQII
jgi:hypothetical protein